jgi:hypothetical protein
MTETSKTSADGEAVRVGKYEPKWGKAIAEKLADGKSWVEICAEDRMPTLMTVHTWLARHPDFAERVAKGRAVAADLWADEALRIARETTAASASADRLRVATLLGRAAVDSPQRWGGKAAPAERPEASEVSFRFRRFEKVVGPDGRTVLREVFPEDEA